jgi:hypothetical protein
MAPERQTLRPFPAGLIPGTKRAMQDYHERQPISCNCAAGCRHLRGRFPVMPSAKNLETR